MTPWFNKYTRPHRVGVYETRVDKYHTEGRGFNYWNGLFWERTTRLPDRYVWSIGFSAGAQHIEWRGFTKEQS